MPDVKFSNKYPYTDFHELNLDWVIKEVKYWSERVGKTIQSISLTGTVGLVDTYTINYSDGTTSTFDVTNGNGITSVTKTGTVGLVDTYTITFENGSTTTFDVNNGTASIDDTLTKSGWAADADETGIGIRKLDQIAFDGKTYNDIFVDNNLYPYGDFEYGLDWVTGNTNNAIITDEAYTSKSHSLKCFGTSSVQIRLDVKPSVNSEVAVLCKVRVDRYASGGGAGFIIGSGTQNLINTPTTGFVTKYYRTSLPSSGYTSTFVGTASAANCDAYLDDMVIVNLTALFGSPSNFPTDDEMKAIYEKWIEIKNSIEHDKSKFFVGAILGASSSAARWKAMRQLLSVCRKKIDSPSYAAGSSDLTFSTSGSVCVLPGYPSGMYQKYDFDIVYSKNGTTQGIPASTTKVMTLVTGLDYITDINERVTIVSDDIEDGGSSLLQADDIVTVKDLMYAMLLPSSNTAAIAFARVAGEKILTSQNGYGTYTPAQCQTAFLAEMVVKATNLGMSNSTFVSPSGRSESNFTTTEDMIRFTIEACSYPEIQKIWNKKTYRIAVQGTNARNIDITTSVADAATEDDYYIIGGKTGTLVLDNTSIALLLVVKYEG